MGREQGQMLSRQEGRQGRREGAPSRHLSQAELGSASHRALGLEGTKNLLKRASFCRSLYPKWMLGSSRDDLCVGPVLVAVRENARTRERVC